VMELVPPMVGRGKVPPYP